MAKSRPTTRINSRLSALATPIALIGRDRKVLFFNQGCEQLTGWEASLVIGSVCEYTTEGDPQTMRAMLGSLCPPPRAFQGEIVEGPAFLPRQSGRPIARQIRHIPFLDDAGEVDCVMVIISDVESAPAIAAASPAQRLHAELTSLRSALRRRFGISTIIAKSEPMLRVVQQVQLAIPAKSPLLLEGEPGVGKEHVARVIHHEMSRAESHENEFRQEAFVPLDCARLLPIDLKRTLRRIFRAAEDDDAETALLPSVLPGTVYLQNVEAMPRDVQEFVVESFGEIPPEARLRFMAGTTADLESLIESDEMRTDFFYQFSALRIALPPLRKRLEDFELLAQALLERMNVGTERQLEGFSDEAWSELREYNWPGNLDELATVIKEAAANCGGAVLGKEDLPFRFRMGRDAQSVGPPLEPLPRPLEAYLEQIEREQIGWALEAARFNKKKAADLLGLTRPKLYRRMEALGIEARDDDQS